VTWPLEGCLAQEDLRELAHVIRCHYAVSSSLLNLANNIESALERIPDDLLA
jgi:hypothetical protein